MNAGSVAGATPPVARPRPHWHQLWRRALAGFAHTAAQLLGNEAGAARPGLLQGLDPRAKLLGLLGLVVTATFLHRLPPLLLLLGASLLLGAASHLSARRLAVLWLTVPLFSALIMLPALLNVITPGTALVTLWQAATPGGRLPTLTITDAGLYVFARFLLRLTVCLTLAQLLTATTRADRLFRGLRSLGVPVLVIMLLTMMERYLTLLLRTAEDMHLARLSRSVNPGPVRDEQAWVAASLATLFRRTQALGNEVYLAMLARGYTGEVRLLHPPAWRPRDTLFLLFTITLAAALLCLSTDTGSL